MSRRLLAYASIALLAGAGLAWARVGGGESWGGGGDGGGGGGGDCAGLLIELFLRVLLRLCIEHPAVGIPLTATLVVCAVMYMRARGGPAAVRSIEDSGAARVIRSLESVQATAALPKLRERDPFFSKPLFLDFAQLLYVRWHLLRGKRDLAPLAPYVSQGLIDRALAGKAVTSVDQVLIGASKVVNVGLGDSTRITVRFVANYTETTAGAATQFYTEESWTFTRAAEVRSKPPEELSRLGCPSCGGAEEPKADGRCPHCGQVVRSGRFHWFVVGMTVLVKKPAVAFAPSGGAEVGTDLPTLSSPTLAEDRRAFQARHLEFSWPTFSAMAKEAFLRLQKAWSEQAWEQARPFETDHLFSTHRFWIERYKAAGLVNRLEQVEVERLVVAKIETDAYYEAITARVYASGFDSTTDKGGKVVAGSKTERRRFSEYWTFVRRIGCEKQGVLASAGCPSCGAPVKLNMAGVCEHCKSKVVTGEFGWVLTAIEQDEEYAG